MPKTSLTQEIGGRRGRIAEGVARPLRRKLQLWEYHFRDPWNRVTRRADH